MVQIPTARKGLLVISKVGEDEPDVHLPDGVVIQESFTGYKALSFSPTGGTHSQYAAGSRFTEPSPADIRQFCPIQVLSDLDLNIITRILVCR